MGRILSIDYGSKRVGVAVTDPYRIIATPLQTVHSKDINTFLENYTKLEQVDCFVIGMPKNLNGSLSDFGKKVKIFIEQVRTQFPEKDIFEYDERFSSKMATQALASGRFSRKDRHNKANIDMVSATIILQSFLDYSKASLNRK